MFFNRNSRGKKPLTSHNIKRIDMQKKKGPAGWARRYALPLGALLVLVSFVLTAVIEPAKAGTYTLLPSGATVAAGRITGGTPATDMDSDNGIYTRFRDNNGSFRLDADITLDPFSAQASKIYKATLSIDAFISSGFDNKNYYVKMYTGATTTQDFDGGSIGPFSSTDGSNDTVTLTETNIAKAQAFYNGGAPEVKILNALAYNGTADNTLSELSIDYLNVTFYEDTNQPTSGLLSPASNSTVSDVIPVTLANVLDNASTEESGMQDVVFEYSSDQVSWFPIGTDTTPDASNNYTVNWDTSALNGAYAVRASARDKVGNSKVVTSTNLMIGSDTQGPNVNIQSPGNFKRVNNPTITAQAQDNVGVTKVEFYSQANPLVPFGIDTDPTGGWTYLWDTSNQINYAENNTYWVRVKAYDAVGNSTTSIENYYTIDRTAPSVANTDPANNIQSVATNRPPIKATFDGPMDQSSFAANNTFKLIQEDNQAIVPGQITGYDSSAYRVTFTPNADLPAEKWFTATLTSGVKDEAGNSLAAYNWRFRTTDTSSPTVSAINPPDATPLKREQRVITATASDNVAVTKVEFYWSEALSGPWYIIGVPDTTIADGWTTTLDTAALPHDGNYYIKALAYDAKYPQNSPGERVVNYSIDKTLPQVLPFSLSPIDGAEGVSISPTIQATFSEAMAEGTVNSTNVYLTRYGSLEVIPTTLTFEPVTKTMTMTLPANTVLNYNAKYTAHLTGGITDLLGNPLEKAITWSFTTIADLVTPVITIQGVSAKTISPKNGDGQKDSTLVTFNLSEKASVYLEVYDSMGNRLYQSPTVDFFDEGALTNLGISWNGKNDAGQFVPDSNYTLYLRAEDTAGNSSRGLVLDQVIVDNRGPFITQVVPESRTKVIITFNEPMDANTSQQLSYNTVLKETYSPVTLTLLNFTKLDSMNFSVESVEKQLTTDVWYTIIINNIFDQVGNSIQNPTTYDFTGFNPHGLYTGNTTYCAKCHLTHSAQGSRLINSNKVKQLCYVCHNGGGQSTYNNVRIELTPRTDSNPTSTIISYHPVEAEKTAGAGKISCEDCHNVHGDELIAGSGILNKKLLRAQKRAKNPVTNEVYFTDEIFNEGNEYCWACHGVNSPYPGGDKETFYPAAHEGSEWEMYEPEAKAKIGCSKCHLHHGSSRIKLTPPAVTFKDPVTQQVTTYNIPDQSTNICSTCHQENPGIASSINYNGQQIYSTNTPHGSDKRCVDCHDAHSEQIPKMLKRTFVSEPDVSTAAYYQGDYNSDNYQTCFSCHPSKLTQKTKDYDPGSGNYSVPTTFWKDDLWDPDNYNPKTNLHDYHLNLKNYKPGFGNITCRECHRVHGSLPEENPDGLGRGKSKMVGFPLRGTVYTEAYDSPQPVWKVILNAGTQPAGGTCNLVCHGKIHDDITYLAGEPPPSAVNKDAACYTADCHGQRMSFDYNDIQSVMGEDSTPGDKLTRHIVTNVTADEAGGNGCLAECHTSHSYFETSGNGKARNTQAMVWTVDQGTGAKTQSQDERLCLDRCHKPSSLAPGAPPISANFTATAHSYEPTTPYHDYGATTEGVFKANCLKCHLPHGSDNSALLSFTNRTNSFGRDSSSITNLGQDNSVCISCHTRPTSPGWPGNPVYTNASNAHGTKNLTGADPDVGYCSSCHEVHGKDDASGLIPKLMKVRGTASCNVCHNDTPIPNSTVPDWSGSTNYNASAHKTVTNSIQTGYCGICHAVHGKDDGTGKPFTELLTAKEEASCWGPASTTTCHSSTTGTPARNNIQSMYTGRTYKHDDPLNLSGKHTSTERSFLPTNRHAECEDCHNSHAAKLTTGAKGTNAVKPSEENVWGITPAEPWPTPAAGTLAAPTNWSVVENSQYEWQICLKCHSKWAYGNSPPPSTTWSGAVATQTDTAAEFNPNNYGHHAVIGPGKNQPGSINPNFSNTFVNGWGPSSTVACSDCHGSDSSADAKGTHGSNFRYILVKNTNGGAVFCSNCHNPNVYGDPTLSPAVSPSQTGSRWTHSQNYSAHSGSAHLSGIWCLNCHMGDGIGGSHGSNKGPGASIDTRGGYTSANNLPLGKRLMNGSNIISYNTKAGGIACWAASSPLSSCTKSHSPQGVTPNYDYTGP